MSKNEEREARVKDFVSRKRFDPSSVIVSGALGEYIPIHPMANQTELLRELGIEPANCVAVDSYWYVDGDVVFLQIYSKIYLQERCPGLYAQWSTKTIPQLYLSAYLNDEAISQQIVESVMFEFYKFGLSSKPFLRRNLEDKLTLMAELPQQN